MLEVRDDNAGAFEELMLRYQGRLVTVLEHLISSRDQGRVISFIDNPNFRGFWYGTNRLFMNAVFFGPTISSYSTR